MNESNTPTEERTVSGNVVPLTPLIDKRNEQQRKVVDLLTEMLEMAKEGTLQGVLLCMDVKGGADEIHVAGTYAERPLLVRGAASSLFHSVHRATE